VEDAALLAETMVGFDAEDPDTRPVARPQLVATALSEPPLPPRFAFVKSSAWEQADPVTREAFAELVDALGEAVVETELGESFNRGVDLHRTVMEVDMATNLHRDYEQGRNQLSQQLRECIERGRTYAAVDYTRALAVSAQLNAALTDLFNEYDAILTPAALGTAPLGMPTGSPVFCSTWTYLGTPAIALPLMATGEGLPLGAQLIGKRGGDARLLRTARWLVKTLGRSGGGRARPPQAPQRRKGKSR
jgi:Asp-tRNA(Asn)/Glu-tRNA(Gln) amidotransferase A subunit family amidase